MKTFEEKQKNALLRKFHALLTRVGVSQDEKRAMLSAYGVESSKDLNIYELTELCSKLDYLANPAASECDRWRKRVMAAVADYLRAMGREATPELIKGTVCRAAQIEKFNYIPADRLKSIYNAFKNRTKDLKTVKRMTGEQVLLKNKVIAEA